MTKNRKKLLKPLTAAAAVPALLFGAAACSDAGEETANNAATQASEAATSATEKAGDAIDSAQSEDSATTTANANDGSAVSEPKIMFDGKLIEGNFAPVKFKHENDDGEEKLKYEAGDGGTELEVDILQGDKPMLDELSLKFDGREWETSDIQEREATVVKTGDRYSVSTEVHEDDNKQNTARVEVTFDVK